ncbi:MAG: dienelactone hydrolase family protein [Ectothiorhodospiraceae bacterium]|nr:dienelactone hydrolase family protein [Ectothiorhodospiraceae bacterium]
MLIERDDVEIATRDGILTAFHAAPSASGGHPAVILYMDAPGIREELRDFARRIAGEGYFCLLPDLYYRFGRIRLEGRRDDEAVATFRAARRRLDNAMVAADTESMLDFLDAHPAVRPGGRGCIGFCQSGRFITTIAGRFPARMAACAAAYGTDIVTDQPDSPHLLVRNIQAEMYYGFAEHDHLVPPNVVPTLRAELETHGVPHQIEIYPGTHHGFCFPQREDVYDHTAAERYWSRLFDLFRRRLR